MWICPFSREQGTPGDDLLNKPKILILAKPSKNQKTALTPLVLETAN
jgi:hypothetical protein